MFSNKKLALAVSGAVLLMAGQFALADSTTDIVDALVSKGVLTEEEGKLISKGHTSQKDKTPTVKEKDGAFILSSPNGKNSVQLTGRLHFDYRANNTNNFGTTANQNRYGVDYDTDTASTADQFLIRRARLGVKGRLGGIADYEAVGNLVGGNTSIVDVAFLDINKYEPLGFKFGKFKQPYNLEEQTSSNNIDFVERSYINQNAPGKKFGAMIHGEFTGATYAASAFQWNDSAQSVNDNKNPALAGRGTVNFAEIFGDKESIYHLGIAGYRADYEVTPALSNNTSDALQPTDTRATVFGFTSGGGGLANVYRAQIGGAPLLTTYPGLSYGDRSPQTASVSNKAGGLEAILARGPFKIQGEFSKAAYFASQNGKASEGAETLRADVDTAYVEALWLVTGEKYADSYKKGAFGAIKPKNEFNFDTGSGWGAWEIGARLDFFDVYHTEVSGLSGNNSSAVPSAQSVSRFQGAIGKANADNNTCRAQSSGTTCANGEGDGGARSYTAGVKWILNPNTLFKVNYVHTVYDAGFKPIDLKSNDTQKFIDHEDLIMVRGQWMF